MLSKESEDIMKKHRYSLLCVLVLLTTIASQAFPTAFEEKRPGDEKAILVPKGARPVLKEEYPRRRLVVDRIKARHRHVLVIPFSRSWNTAALTAMNALRIEEEPDLEPRDFELGFALHSQRLKVGSLQNREYFRKETEGFSKGWYRSLAPLELIEQTTGYMSTTFVHLTARRSRRTYEDYLDFSDRIGGILNLITTENKQLTLTAQRDMDRFRTEVTGNQPRVRNTASISYALPGGNLDKITFSGGSVWSTLTDSAERDFRYITGIGSVSLYRSLRPDFDVDAKARLRISYFRDNSVEPEPKILEKRRSGLLQVSNIVSPSQFLKLKLNVSGLFVYDSRLFHDPKYEGYFMPGMEIVLGPKTVQAAGGVRRRVIVPERDELYWSSKIVKVNDDLQPEDFWEAYGSLKVNVIARLRLLAEVSASRPESRITWKHLPGFVWEPVNAETSEALTGEASMTFNLIGGLGTYAGLRYQYFDNQLFDPEITSNAGIYYDGSTIGSITLGGSFWTFQPMEDTEQPEELVLVYGRFSKTVGRIVSIFVEGRYTINDEDVVYYRGMPQAGRIVSAGANIVFGGLD